MEEPSNFFMWGYLFSLFPGQESLNPHIKNFGVGIPIGRFSGSFFMFCFFFALEDFVTGCCQIPAGISQHWGEKRGGVRAGHCRRRNFRNVPLGPRVYKQTASFTRFWWCNQGDIIMQTYFLKRVWCSWWCNLSLRRRRPDGVVSQHITLVISPGAFSTQPVV